MGCMYAKTIEYEQKAKRGRLRALFGRDHRRTKVQAIHIGDPVRVPVNEGTPMLNLARKTEQTVLTQLREEGIIPNKGSGGVAFTVDIDKETPRSSTLDDDYCQLPGVPQYTRDVIKTVPSRPRTLPPLTPRGALIKLPPEVRESNAEGMKNEALRRKGKMARLSNHRRELAAAKREAREKERRELLEMKMMRDVSQNDGDIDKVNVDDRLERARINREIKAEEKRARIEAKLAGVPRTDTPSRVLTEERLERARQNREKRLAGTRWVISQRRTHCSERNRVAGTSCSALREQIRPLRRVGTSALRPVFCFTAL